MDRAFRRACSAALLSLLALAADVSADSYQTTTRFDTFDGVCDEDCSLRDAVVASNANPGPDVILLQYIPQESGLHVLTLTGPDEDHGATGDLDIAAGEELTIIGAGANPTVIDGLGSFGSDRVFDVRGSLELRDVIVRSGSPSGPGGAIRNSGRVTLINCEVRGNETRGFGFGGGIYSDGADSELTLRHTVVSANQAEGGGGGLAVGGRLTVVDSIIRGNESLQDFGGGVYLFAEARAEFTNVLFSGNRAAIAGGAVYVEPPIFPGTPIFRNVIVRANSAPVGPNCAGACWAAH